MGAEDRTPVRRREGHAERAPRKRRRGLLLVLLLFVAAPAAAAGWYALQPPEKQEAIRAKLPAGWEDRAAKAGICLAALFALAVIVLPILHRSAQALGAGLDALGRKPTWLKVVLAPVWLVMWILFQVARLGRIADAIGILALCVLFLVLVVRIMKPELLADVLPDVLQ